MSLSDYCSLYEYSEERFRDFCLKIRDGSMLPSLEQKVKAFEETCDLEEIHVDLVSKEFINEHVEILKEKLKEKKIPNKSEERLFKKNTVDLIHNRLRYQHAAREPYKHLEVLFHLGVKGDTYLRGLLARTYPEVSQKIFFQDRYFNHQLDRIESFKSLISSLKKLGRGKDIVLSARAKRQMVEKIVLHLSQGNVDGYEHDFDFILSAVYTRALKKHKSVSLRSEQDTLLTDFATAFNSLDVDQKKELIATLKNNDMSYVHMLYDLIYVLKKCKEYSSETIISSEVGGLQRKKFARLVEIFDQAVSYVRIFPV